jgi:hypothetical protein
VATAGNRSQLRLRPLEGVTAKPLPGTDYASAPFWSPNGRSLGFFADGKLKRIDIDGGSLQTLTSAIVSAGGTWNRDGVNSVFPEFQIVLSTKSLHRRRSEIGLGCMGAALDRRSKAFSGRSNRF